MNSKKQLKRLESMLDNIRSIARVFEHTAATQIDVNRREMQALAGHLQEALVSYSSAKIAVANAQKKKAGVTLAAAMRAPAKRKVLVLIASESKYFGNIIGSLASLFVSEFRQGGADAVVVGRIGYDLLKNQGQLSPSMTFYDFNDDKPDWSIIQKVVTNLNNYSEVVIFYGKYKSILTQEAEREDIGQAVKVNTAVGAKKYAFEGGDKKALAILEKQIISSSFMQKLYQSGLAKNAVAVKILEIGAIAERINTAFFQLAKWKLRFNKDVANRKQTQLYGSRGLWEKGGIFG